MHSINQPLLPNEHPIDVASRLVGGRHRLAVSLDVSPAAVGNWKVRGIPVEHCKAIERFTEGAVTCQEMRPDDWHKYWPELAPAQSHPAQPAIETVAQA